MSDPIASAGPTVLIPQDARGEVQRHHANARQGGDRDPRIWRTAVEFEAVFLSQMLEQMFTGTEVEEPFGGGSAEQTWKSLMNQEYGRAVARSGGVGIADHVYREMLRMQEG